MMRLNSNTVHCFEKKILLMPVNVKMIMLYLKLPTTPFYISVQYSKEKEDNWRSNDGDANIWPSHFHTSLSFIWEFISIFNVYVKNYMFAKKFGHSSQLMRLSVYYYQMTKISSYNFDTLHTYTAYVHTWLRYLLLILLSSWTTTSEHNDWNKTNYSNFLD